MSTDRDKSGGENAGNDVCLRGHSTKTFWWIYKLFLFLLRRSSKSSIFTVLANLRAYVLREEESSFSVRQLTAAKVTPFVPLRVMTISGHSLAFRMTFVFVLITKRAFFVVLSTFRLTCPLPLSFQVLSHSPESLARSFRPYSYNTPLAVNTLSSLSSPVT